MTKTADDVVRVVERRLIATWPISVLAEAGLTPPSDTCDGVEDETGDDGDTSSRGAGAWPYTISLGRMTSAQAAADFGAQVESLQRWRSWSSQRGLELREQTRRIAGTQQVLATHVVVPDLATAAALAGPAWPARLALARTRVRHLLQQFPHLSAAPGLARALRGVVELDDVDFDILCRTAHWFRTHPAQASHGLTPRQVPLAGIHAKWLNHHQGLVRTLSGLEDFGLLPCHPPRVHFTYLDSDHLAAGGRRHDSHSLGDRADPAYQPRVVVISENKDTAVGFPPVPGGISVEGAGAGGGTIAQVPWIRDAAHLIYWGDMDADGLRILNEFRAAGLPVTSMLMDLQTYRTYQDYGTNSAPNGQLLRVPKQAPVPYLTAEEVALYELLTSGTAPVLRIEQERIPLHVAARELLDRLVSPSPTP